MGSAAGRAAPPQPRWGPPGGPSSSFQPCPDLGETAVETALREQPALHRRHTIGDDSSGSWGELQGTVKELVSGKHHRSSLGQRRRARAADVLTAGAPGSATRAVVCSTLMGAIRLPNEVDVPPAAAERESAAGVASSRLARHDDERTRTPWETRAGTCDNWHDNCLAMGFACAAAGAPVPSQDHAAVYLLKRIGITCELSPSKGEPSNACGGQLLGWRATSFHTDLDAQKVHRPNSHRVRARWRACDRSVLLGMLAPTTGG